MIRGVGYEGPVRADRCDDGGGVIGSGVHGVLCDEVGTGASKRVVLRAKLSVACAVNPANRWENLVGGEGF